MTAAYYSILTNNGKALIANATVSTPIGFSDIAVGDGNGSVPTPLETRTALVNEKARFTCNSVALNPNNTNWIEAEIIIPTTSGGYTIRELGLYAGATLVAVANFPSTYKPLETEGGAREIAIKMVINVQNAEVISVTLDNSLVYATRDWVNTYYIPRTDIVDNLTTNDASKPVSAKQAKVLQDNKLAKTGNAVSASKLLIARKIGGVSFDGSADIDLPSGTTDAAGILKLVNDLTTGGMDKALSAEQGKILFTMFTGGTAYFRIPNTSDPTKPWIVQFGVGISQLGSDNISDAQRITFPIVFPNSCLHVGITTNVTETNPDVIYQTTAITTAGFKAFANKLAATNGFTIPHYFAIGN